ncbi:IscS subfamily cysteine desulfurase [Halobacillus sp. A5]|uniref:IscS subfamily cysteine desulfurase n=1 Tax=Halobacillus sp. A5 TaxID=2880263 RepID=UPI0020A65804|nr:IscS subfamily cysteine desulfurase [Halobacillus sp. A5]MCP3027981.1 IscS subfamily cysteine desulfurase [Halobacillus sp. A5]
MKYFDFAATCPISNEALQAYIKASQDYYGNTKSLHDVGTKADTLVEYCRTTLAGLLGADPQGLTFTSGGTESNMIAIHSLAEASKGRHIIISAGEHSSIKNVTTKLSKQGFIVSEVPLTKEGIVNLEELKRLIREDTSLISIQHVNSDIGSINPIEKIHKICKENDILLHSDCVQSFGKIDLSTFSSLVDSFTISSHKIYGPKGVGALYIHPSISILPFLPNVTHENGIRPGTLNTPGIAAFTTAANERLSNLPRCQDHFQQLKKEFFKNLNARNHRVEVLGSNVASSIPIIGICIKEMNSQHVLLEANRIGYSFSTGSACQSKSNGPSPTLLSMGISEEKAATFLRISFGMEQTLEDVRSLAEDLLEILLHSGRP